MSHIFDALQRAQSGNSATEAQTLTLVTDLLRSAEEQVQASALSARPQIVADTFDAVSAVATATLEAAPEVATTTFDAAPSVAAEILDAAPAIATSTEDVDRCPSLAVSISEESHLVSVTAEESLAAEKFRFLAVKLRQLRQHRPLKKILITSTIPQEGKSTIAANLACTLARRRQHRTLLLEGDLRRPSISQQFGIGKIPGICEWLSGKTPQINIYRLDNLGLWLLPAGAAPENPLELMQSGKLSALMQQLEEWFDWIVIDSPPVLPLADTSVWSRLSDGILLVTRKGTTERQQLQRGFEAIEKSKILGALVNSSATAAHNDYYRYYTSSAADTPKA